jgi:hypothetical protein
MNYILYYLPKKLKSRRRFIKKSIFLQEADDLGLPLGALTPSVILVK